MVTYNDLTIENANFIRRKAQSKDDGVYTIRGIGYRVREGCVTHFAAKGIILLNAGYFTTQVGSYSEREEGQRLLKGIE